MIDGKVDVLEAQDWFTMLVVPCEDLSIQNITDRRLLHLVHTIEGAHHSNETIVTVRPEQTFTREYPLAPTHYPGGRQLVDVYVYASKGNFRFETTEGMWDSPEGALLHFSGGTPWRYLPWDGERVYFKLETPVE